MDKKTKIVVIGGPTATGKTKVSIELAKRYDGEIISSDSMQIYKHLDIGSAKPTKEEMDGIPHYMIDEISPFESFSVCDFVLRAKEYIKDISSRGKLPIIVGGTGLYISSLVDNVDFSSAAPQKDIREELTKRLLSTSKEAMHDELKTIDPLSAATIHKNNTKRVIRALEIYYTTGKTMTEQNAISKLTPTPYEAKMFALSAPREILYERIDRRVDIMVENGLLDEVSALIKMGLTPLHQAMQGIGYKELFPYFEGKISLSDAISLIKQNSRRYAKRQLTWFRRDERYTWLDITSGACIDKLEI